MTGLGFKTPVKRRTGIPGLSNSPITTPKNQTPVKRFALSPQVNSPTSCRKVGKSSRRISIACNSPQAISVALKACKEKTEKSFIECKAPSSTTRATRKISTKTYDRFIPNRVDVDDSGHFDYSSNLAPKVEKEHLSDSKVAYQQSVAKACGVCDVYFNCYRSR
jgi:hypothetical protein